MVISIVNHKGGTGKTTTTLNLGACLRDRGYKVLLVDLDAQGNLSYSLGVSMDQPSLAELIYDEIEFNQVVVELEGLKILPSNSKLADVELALGNSENRYQIMKNIIESIEENFDFIIIDCPPSLSILTLNALNTSNYVIIPLLMEVLSVRGLEMIMDTINKVKKTFNPELELLGALPVMIDKRKNLNNEIMEHIRENFSVNLFKSSIRANVKASEAPSFGMSVINYAPASNSALDYKLLTTEILESIFITQKIK
jgi:chromosome partitioning protein